MKRTLHLSVRQPNDAVQENGTDWGDEGKAVGFPKADGFAVSKLLYSAADFKTSAPSLRK